ncbi:hypothetical protein ACROYT_G019802 [Oculina patagonica]
MLTRLTESLDEIRLKGWVFPFTLLIKGPHEDVEVIKEAWRRHFLRSPDNFIIRDIGAVSSIGMEVIQQAPFLPLTKSLVETIAALNGSQQKGRFITRVTGTLCPATVLLINPRTRQKKMATPMGLRNLDVWRARSFPKENLRKVTRAKKKGKGREKESAKDKENGKVKNSVKEADNLDTKTPVNHAEPKRVEGEKEVKSPTPQVQEVTTKAPSETASETSSEGTNKKAKKQKKGVLNQISCFIKGKTLSAAEVSEETKQEQTVPSPSPPPQLTDAKQPAPLAEQEDTSLSLTRNERSLRLQFRNKRALSAPADNPSLYAAVPSKQLEESGKIEVNRPVPKPRELARSKSFVAPEKRPPPVQRSNSFTAPSTRVARQISTESAPVAWDRRQRINYGDIIRNAPGRRTIHISGPSSYNIGVVRPLDMTQQRPLSRSNSMKKETPRKKGGSLSPPGTPRMPLTPSGNPNSNRPDVFRSKSFTEPGIVRLANRQFSYRPTMVPHYESPLQQLLARKTPGYTAPPSTAVRVTVPPKGRHYAPARHSLASSKRTSPNSPSRKQPKQPAGLTPKEKPYNRNDCTSPICYDTSMINDKVTNCLCNGGVNNAEGTAKVSPVPHPNYNYRHVGSPSDGVSSEHICIEEMTSTSASEVTLNEDIDRYAETRADNEGKPLGLYKKITDEGVNDSLTFIGII